MSNIEVETFCPLGSTCEEAVDGKIKRCCWLTCLSGKDPQSEDKFKDEWACAMAWLPIMLVENAQMMRGNRQATESFRNEMVKTQDTFNKIVAVGIDNQNKRLIDG